MLLEALIQRFGSGKNVKLFYFLAMYGRRMVPRHWYMWRRRHLLERLRHRPDFPLLKARIDYYCHFKHCTLPPGSPAIGANNRVYKDCAKVYRLDSDEACRYFAPQLRWRMAPGDNVTAHAAPTIVKSRPITDGGTCDVLLKLNRVRHFIFLHDSLSWADKKPKAIFRGRVSKQMRRLEFIKAFAGSELVDAKCLDSPDGLPPGCRSRKLTLHEQLEYKFVVCLEGNDVASNLKWVMNSNSIAVMPPPLYEIWFMEGRLVPDVHYIAVKPDFSDVEERLRYYLEHPREAQRIIDNAHRWTAQFKDKKTERMLAVAVMHNYMVRTGQLNEPEV